METFIAFFVLVAAIFALYHIFTPENNDVVIHSAAEVIEPPVEQPVEEVKQVDISEAVIELCKFINENPDKLNLEPTKNGISYNILELGVSGFVNLDWAYIEQISLSHNEHNYLHKELIKMMKTENKKVSDKAKDDLLAKLNKCKDV